MEELLQTVTSLRKDFQDRRQSRKKLDNVPSLYLPSELTSPRSLIAQPSSSKSVLSKISTDRPPRTPKNRLQDEFSKFMHSPLRSPKRLSPAKGSYKLDAASLLFSRVKEFLLRRFRQWRNNSDWLRNGEKRSVNSRNLVFRVNVINQAEKQRYLSRGRSSDEEGITKANTSRVSQNSPEFIGVGRLRVNSRAKAVEERAIPSSTRAASSVSQRSFEKFNKKIMAGVEKIEKLRQISRENQMKLAMTRINQYSKLRRAKEIEQEKVHKPLVSGASRKAKYDLIKASAKVLNKVFLSKISEIFFFIKFRCVIESELFEDSGNIESSQDNLRECLDRLRRSSQRNTLGKSQKKVISYLVLAPSFANLMESVEQSAKQRYLTYILQCVRLHNNYQQFVSKLDGIVTNFKKRAFFIIKTKRICKKYIQRAILSLISSIEKDLNHKISSCFTHWKSLCMHFNQCYESLAILTLSDLFLSLTRSRLKLLFTVYSITKHSKRFPNQRTIPKLSRALCILQKPEKFLCSKAFLNWKLHRPTLLSASPTPSLIYLTRIFLSRIRIPFARLRSISTLHKASKILSLRLILRRFTWRLKLRFFRWKNLTNSKLQPN